MIEKLGHCVSLRQTSVHVDMQTFITTLDVLFSK